MKIMKELKKAGIGMFLTLVMASLFAMNVSSADKGYVGEDETEIDPAADAGIRPPEEGEEEY